MLSSDSLGGRSAALSPSPFTLEQEFFRQDWFENDAAVWDVI